MAKTDGESLSVTEVEDASSTVGGPPGCLLFAAVYLFGCVQHLQLVACTITADGRVLGANPALQRLVDLALSADPVTYSWAPGTVPDLMRVRPGLIRVPAWPTLRYLAVLAPEPAEGAVPTATHLSGGRDARWDPIPGDVIYNCGEVSAVYHTRMSIDRWRNLAKASGATVQAIKGGHGEHD